MKNLRLRAARAAKGLSQQAHADLVGAARQPLTAIEQGAYNPPINRCIAICRALDKTLDGLFWEEAPPPEN
ncbi:MAG: helix-turn-helix transcriptional regulator [Oscillospiraceae bacterium]|nr:helix-turn-helix transcriptional regulator [Oscillospiraceae bacterium]